MPPINQIGATLDEIVEKYVPLLATIPVEHCTDKPSPTKWSKIEILGHLVDSAHNNLRRFIVGQYEEKPYIVYDQDQWVAFSQYNQYNLRDLIAYWQMVNKHISHILHNMSHDNGELVVQSQEIRTLHWLADDYIKHLLHHLHQILNLDPIPYP